jgi:hypothetical protein
VATLPDAKVGEERLNDADDAIDIQRYRQTDMSCPHVSSSSSFPITIFAGQETRFQMFAGKRHLAAGKDVKHPKCNEDFAPSAV